MKPFTAWLAMGHSRRPLQRSVELEDSRRWAWVAFSSRRIAKSAGAAEPQRVLIVADTPENRKKLGMEEGS